MRLIRTTDLNVTGISFETSTKVVISEVDFLKCVSSVVNGAMWLIEVASRIFLITSFTNCPQVLFTVAVQATHVAHSIIHPLKHHKNEATLSTDNCNKWADDNYWNLITSFHVLIMMTRKKKELSLLHNSCFFSCDFSWSLPSESGSSWFIANGHHFHQQSLSSRWAD